MALVAALALEEDRGAAQREIHPVVLNLFACARAASELLSVRESPSQPREREREGEWKWGGAEGKEVLIWNP